MAQAPQQQPAYQPPGGSGPSGPRASFWARLGAFLIDAIVVAVVTSVVTAGLGTDSVESFTSTFQRVNVLLGLLYFTYFEGGPAGQSLGKKVLNIRVIDFGGGGSIGYGRAFIRSLGRNLSGLILGLGYFWMLWDDEKQTWHDKFATSVVVPVDAYPIGMQG